jgi:hypothetical protein
MTETAIREWQRVDVDENGPIKAPAGMIRAVKRNDRQGNVFQCDFATLDKAIRVASIGMDDDQIRVCFFSETGEIVYDLNPLTATVTHDWRDLTSARPKAPKGMFRAVLSDLEATFTIEQDFATLEAAKRVARRHLGEACTSADIYDDTGEIVHQM